MKSNRFALLAVLVLLATLLSACGGTPVASTWPGLAADGKNAYLADGAVVYAIRIKDHQELWRFPEKASTKLSFYANPVFLSDGQLLIGSSGSQHTLYRVDPESGKDNWSFDAAADHWVASPLVVGDMVYAPNADGFLYVFDFAKEGDDKLVTKVELGGKLWSQPATDGTTLYVPSLDHHLHAVDMKTYEVKWVTDLGGAVPGTPAVADGKVFIGSFSKSLQAVNAVDGSIAWTADTQSWIWGGPALDNGVLYFGDINGNFYAINAADGKPAADATKPDDGIIATPLILNGQVIFVSESGNVFSLTPGGNAESMEKLDGKAYTPAIAAGDLILVAPFQSKAKLLLVALDADGKVVWSFTPEK